MKVQRQFAIKEIIGKKPIANQDLLRTELKKRGYDVTQATLSRDLREMGVVRMPGDHGVHYELQQSSENEIHLLQPLMASQVLSLASNESMIVVKTLPGCASVVGEYIDSLGGDDVIGTIAGDNTLLVIPSSMKKTHHLLMSLRNTLIEGKE